MSEAVRSRLRALKLASPGWRGSLNPAAPSDLHAKLAAAYLQRGNADKAYAEMQTYVRTDPSGRFAAQARSLMHEIESSSSSSARRRVEPAPAKP